MRTRVEYMLKDFLASTGSIQGVNIGEYLHFGLLGPKDYFLIFHTTREFLEHFVEIEPVIFLVKSCF